MFAILRCTEGSPPNAGAARESLLKFRRGCRLKGSLSQLVPKPSPGMHPESEGSSRQRKLANWFGRAREFVFQTGRARSCAQLHVNLQRTWPQEVRGLSNY